MRIAVVGTGIAGLACARQLQEDHEVTVFEAADYVGGHVATVDVEAEGRTWAVDTGFIVFNTRTYPNFVRLLGELEVTWRESEMSFSARCDSANVEYCGSGPNGLFAQRRNLARPAFWRMVRDILRFYREAPELLVGEGPGPSLGEYLEARGFGEEFVRWHLVPMAAAVWSSPPDEMLAFPARYLVQFFHNHGFLSVRGRPQWLTVPGGSREYVRALVRGLRGRVRLQTPIRGLRRLEGGVLVTPEGGPAERFDRVVLACHSDQALTLLDDATPLEREVLGGFRYQANDVVLHTDASVMPERKRAWSAWNYHIDGPGKEHSQEHAAPRANVTYWMNRLQGLEAETPFLVTLNHTRAIDPAKVLRTFTYHHPVYDHGAVAAQARHAELNGSHGVYFAGAYWGYGFHEDGVNSALAVCSHLAREEVLA